MRAAKALHVFGISVLCLGGIAVGSALHLPAMAAQVYQQYLSPDTTCTSSSPCTTTTNNGSGPASANTSVGGTALTGTTKFNSTSKTKFAVGVLGTDSSTKGKFDVGVEGTSVSGTGALGNTKSGTGVSGVATTGTGVSGVSTNGFGVTGSSTTGFGVVGSSQTAGILGQGNATGSTGVEAISSTSNTNGTGVLSYALGTGGVGVSANGNSFGLQASGSTAVQATTATGTALELDSSGGILINGFNSGTETFFVDELGDLDTTGSIQANSAGISSTTLSPSLQAIGPESAFEAISTDSSSTTPAIRAFSNGGPLFAGYKGETQVFYVDSSGNEIISGFLYTAGSCNSGCITHGPQQKRVVSYESRESQPTIEDFGEAQLVNGEAQVALDSSFANVIDKNATYMVFTSPEGDCNGLFIAHKSTAGFEVRELRGGHSTLTFDYRIVAKPFGDHSARLPMIASRAQFPENLIHKMPKFKPATRH
ncbi:MAG TPA: hypothetical protein VKT51_11280 [Candidatus Eremiobacteraceae bacterium]|nr:hypothetical protein [Candidatus Eremiobacteraceae bacterium]